MQKLVWVNAALAFLLGFVLFACRIEVPDKIYFDETHYTPAAREMLEFKQVLNHEHPPLGKAIIASGVAIFGDGPLGRRVMSAVFGALALAGIFAWGAIHFSSLSMGWWVATLALSNHFLFVHARIAMLDIFMVAFIVWAGAWASVILRSRVALSQNRAALIMAALAVGLSAACKWYGIVAFGVFGALLLMELLKRRRFLELSDWSALFGFYVIPAVGVYFLAFVPFLWMQDHPFRFADLFGMQLEAARRQAAVPGKHPYMSAWWSWPFILRPIWYFYEREGPNNALMRGVFMVGNPLTMITGVLSLFWCIWLGFVRRHQRALEATVGYLMFYFAWAMIPRSVSFYYYYFVPAICLGFCLGHVFQRQKPIVRWSFAAAAVIVFAYFFPVLAGVPVSADRLRQFSWFFRWI